jgi:hypothetical protein
MINALVKRNCSHILLIETKQITMIKYETHLSKLKANTNSDSN